ncbi:hypothetical protein LTR95_001896 [Oleoguttula sp. CCFEE 5521]
MDVSMSWALPVKVDRLGAHLQAYVETLDTIITLRLCNRHGAGSGIFVQKLPVEIVQIIEKLIFREICKAKYPEWQVELHCFENECRPVDHLSREEQLDCYFGHDDYTADVCCDCQKEAGLPSHDEPDDEQLQKRLAKLDEQGHFDNYEWYDVHSERQGDWVTRVGNAKSIDGFFDEHDELLGKHFGVSVWTSHVRLDREKWRHNYDAAHTIVAYLTLPDPYQRELRWEMSEDDRECGPWTGCESGYGIPVKLIGHPTPASLQRFARAMNILDLKVFEHESQAGPPVGFRLKNAVIKEGPPKKKTWPKITLLQRSLPID